MSLVIQWSTPSKWTLLSVTRHPSGIPTNGRLTDFLFVDFFCQHKNRTCLVNPHEPSTKHHIRLISVYLSIYLSYLSICISAYLFRHISVYIFNFIWGNDILSIATRNDLAWLGENEYRDNRFATLNHFTDEPSKPQTLHSQKKVVASRPWLDILLVGMTDKIRSFDPYIHPHLQTRHPNK